MNDLSEDLRFLISNKYSKLVNKAKNIAQKLIDIMKSDIENSTQHNDALNERIEAKNILKTITDIDTINEIRNIIDNQSKQLGKYYFPIFVLIQERFIELVAIINQQKKLEILNNEEKNLKSKLTEINNILNKEIINIADIKYEHIFDAIKLQFKEAKKIFDEINKYFINIKKLQDEAKNILTQNYRNTLSAKLSERQRSIENTILKIESVIKLNLNEINNLLIKANNIKISIIKQKFKEEEKEERRLSDERKKEARRLSDERKKEKKKSGGRTRKRLQVTPDDTHQHTTQDVTPNGTPDGTPQDVSLNGTPDGTPQDVTLNGIPQYVTQYGTLQNVTPYGSPTQSEQLTQNLYYPQIPVDPEPYLTLTPRSRRNLLHVTGRLANSMPPASTNGRINSLEELPLPIHIESSSESDNEDNSNSSNSRTGGIHYSSYLLKPLNKVIKKPSKKVIKKPSKKVIKKPSKKIK